MGTAFCQNEVCFCHITVWNHNTPKWKLAEIYRDSPKPASLMFVRVGFGPEWKIWFIESLWLRNLQATEKRFPLGTTNPGFLSPSTSALTTFWKTPFPSLKFCECARLNTNKPLAASGEGFHPACLGRAAAPLSQGPGLPSAGEPQPPPPPNICSSREQQQQVRTWWLLRKIALCQLNNTL